MSRPENDLLHAEITNGAFTWADAGDEGGKAANGAQEEAPKATETEAGEGKEGEGEDEGEEAAMKKVHLLVFCPLFQGMPSNTHTCNPLAPEHWAARH